MIDATAQWAAWPKNDRLKRWMVVSLAGTGRGKAIIADNIRSELIARQIADDHNGKPYATDEDLAKSMARYLCYWRNGKRSNTPYEELPFVEQQAYLEQAGTALHALRRDFSFYAVKINWPMPKVQP